MKVNFSYSTRVRIEGNVEIRIEYRRHRSKTITNIVMANKDKDSNVRYEKKFNKFYTLLLNFYLLTKQNRKGNQLLDKLLIKAKQEMAN